MNDETAFDPVAATRRIVRLGATGALGTLLPDGHPFSSFVTVATTPAGEPLMLLSRLAVHTQNLAGDPRASLLLVAPGGEGGDPLAGGRVTVVGEARPAEDAEAARRRFLARHKEASGYAGFADFAFYRLAVDRAHLVAGFGRIHEIAVRDLLLDAPDDLVALEPSAVEHMNADHADAVELYATRLCGEAPGRWRVTGIDAGGLDMRLGERTARLDFPAPLADGTTLRTLLADLARHARERT